MKANKRSHQLLHNDVLSRKPRRVLALMGLHPLAYLEMKERAHSPEATALALALRGLKPFKMFLTTFVRNTTCVNEVMKIVKTQGLSTVSVSYTHLTLPTILLV